MKTLFLTILATCTTLGAVAQEKSYGPFETNRARDNWFIQGGVGTTVYLGGQNAPGLGSRLRPTFDLGFGKWFTPTIGARLAMNYTSGMREYSSHFTSPFVVSPELQKFNMFNVHTDFLFNFSAAVAGYKPSRVYEAIPYMGVGWAHINGENSLVNNNVALNVGLINKFNISPTVDINLELRSTIMDGRFDCSTINNKIDAPVAAVVGVTVRLGKVKGFKPVVAPIKPDYSSYNNRIAALEDKNKVLEGENAKLDQENKALLDRPVTVVKENTSSVEITPVALFFNIGKATLDSKELANLEFFVKNAIDKDPNRKFTVIGGADKETGTAASNMILSEKRMQYVYDILVTKYGISPLRLVKQADGDKDNMFAEPALNRTVIIK